MAGVIFCGTELRNGSFVHNSYGIVRIMNDNTLLPVLGSRTQGDLLACSASTESFRESKELILHIFLDRGPQDTKEFPDLTALNVR